MRAAPAMLQDFITLWVQDAEAIHHRYPWESADGSPEEDWTCRNSQEYTPRKCLQIRTLQCRYALNVS